MELTALILDDDELLSLEQVAAKLGHINSDWSKPQLIYEWTRSRNNGTRIPHRKVRGRLMFVWREVLDWLDKQAA